MWNLSALAQRAKDAAVQIENQINDSIGAIIPEDEDENAAAENPETDGYLNVEEECVSFSERDDETQQHCDDDIDTQPKDTRQRVESAPSTGEISFVDLKSVLPEPESCDGNSAVGNNDSIEELLGRVTLLEQTVKSLEEQLMSAKEESEKYYASNVELLEQVRELKEENKLLKDNSLREEKE